MLEQQTLEQQIEKRLPVCLKTSLFVDECVECIHYIHAQKPAKPAREHTFFITISEVRRCTDALPSKIQVFVRDCPGAYRIRAEEMYDGMRYTIADFHLPKEITCLV